MISEYKNNGSKSRIVTKCINDGLENSPNKFDILVRLCDFSKSLYWIVSNKFIRSETIIKIRHTNL